MLFIPFSRNSLQLMSDAPEVGENRLEQRALEELDARRAARAAFAADGALDQLDVPVSPLLEASSKSVISSNRICKSGRPLEGNSSPALRIRFRCPGQRMAPL